MSIHKDWQQIYGDMNLKSVVVMEETKQRNESLEILSSIEIIKTMGTEQMQGIWVCFDGK